MEEIKWPRNEVNKHKGHGGLQCECCGHNKNGLRRRRRSPRYMLRALAHGKKVHYYPLYQSPIIDDDHVPGLSSWKKILKRQEKNITNYK